MREIADPSKSLAQHTPTQIAVAVVEHANCFLVGQRPPGVPLAGMYEFPGGKVQGDETAGEAARRECLEETGLMVQLIEPYLDQIHTYEHGSVRLHFFRCRPIDADQPPRAPFCWIPRDELSRYEFPAGNAEVLMRLAASDAVRNSD